MGDERTGAALLVRALESLEVGVVFGLPGVHNLAAWDALEKSSLRLVGVRHEQAAVYAADGQARVSGSLGVAVTTTGPGAANTLGATGEAWASGSPVMVIATNVPSGLRREGVCRGVLHESPDQGAMFAPLVKDVVRIERAEEIATAVTVAAALAETAPTGPVYVEIPTDLLSAEAVGDDDRARPEPRRPSAPAEASLAAALDLLREAERPLVWAGGGVTRAGAGAALAELSQKLCAPVIETYMGRGALDPDSPTWLGLPPHVPEVGGLWDEADLVLAVGTDFDGMMTQNWRMERPDRLVAVNVDPGDAGKNYRPDVTVAADARAALEALSEGLEPRGDLDALRARLDEIRAAVWSALEDDEPLAAELLGALRTTLDPAVPVFADMCVPGYWVAAFHSFAAPRRLAYPVGWGTLGFAFPAAVGAALATGEQVLSICGDGGFLFALGELATVAQERAPLTVLLVDDGGYGMLRFDQEVTDMDTVGVDLQTPDWARLAASFGIACEEVEGFGAPFAAALGRQLADPQPSILLVRARMKPPPSTSPRWYRKAGGVVGSVDGGWR
ncbi:MAG: thiamine pyrophosphate-binding protein [Actinobacteria bacterium]|nr:thiamine pyrophosphate-binding protein [Actinomycetota bacterium]